MITYGPLVGKPVVIVDIVDQSRALVEGPTSGVPRQVVSFRRLQLTDFKIALPRAAGTKALLKASKKSELEKQWLASPFAKKQDSRMKRANMTDFDRFKLMLAKKKRRVMVYREVNKLKKTAA